MPFRPKYLDSLSHQVHGAKRMMEPCMQCARINQVRHAKLPDPAQPLEIWMLDQQEHPLTGEPNESIDRVIDDF